MTDERTQKVFTRTPKEVYNKNTKKTERNGEMEHSCVEMTLAEFEEKYPINFKWYKYHNAFIGETADGSSGIWRTLVNFS